MGAIQSSINTALGVAAIASGLTNKKQVEKAQDKLDDKTKELTNKKDQLAKTAEENYEVNKQQAKDAEADIKNLSAEKDEQIEKNMKSGGNTYNVPKDLPTAKETNIDNTGDKSVSVGDKSINNLGSSMNDYLKYQQKVNPFEAEQIMGFRALKMLDSRIAAKKAIVERSKRAMIRARKMGGNE